MRPPEFDSAGMSALRVSLLTMLTYVLGIAFLPMPWWARLLLLLVGVPILTFIVFCAGSFDGARVTYNDFPRLMREEEDHEPFPDVSSGGYAFLVDDGVNRLH